MRLGIRLVLLKLYSYWDAQSLNTTHTCMRGYTVNMHFCTPQGVCVAAYLVLIVNVNGISQVPCKFLCYCIHRLMA